MAHVIKLTGYAKSTLRVIYDFYSFDMEEKGGSAATGLPIPSIISYTVFVNQNQLDKAGLNSENLHKHKLIIEGGLCLDVPIDLCPGEIGVSCDKLTIAIKKEKPIKKALNMPEHDAVVPMKYISLPDVLHEKYEYDTTKIKQYIEVNGFIDKPVYVQFREGRLLVYNGYVQYMAAKEAGLNSVPVKFQKLSKKYVPEGTDDVMLVDDIIIPEEFLKFIPSKRKLDNVHDYFMHNGMIPSPVMIDKNSGLLHDGYAKYYVMKELNIPYIPVMFRK